MNKIISIIVSIIMIISISSMVYAVAFTDVENHWAIEAITRWSNESVINGYEDGTFKPNNNITRAEFVTMIVRIFKPVETANISMYEDINPNAWYYENISKAVAIGAIKGDSDTIMRPESNITRQEAIVILNRILKLEISGDETTLAYTDSDMIADWASDAVTAFINHGFLKGYEDGSIKPTAYITRAETATLLNKSVPPTEMTYIDNKEENNINENSNDVNIPDENTELTVILTKNKKGYDVKKTGEVKDNSKLTFKIDDVVICENEEFSRENYDNLKKNAFNVIEANILNGKIDPAMLFKSLKKNYSDEDFLIDIAQKLLDSTSDEDRDLVNKIMQETMEGKSFTEIYENLSIGELKKLASVISDIDYDTFLDILKNL